MNEQKTLEHLHLTNTGNVSNKWSSYLPYYDSIFSKIRNENIAILEIGVQNGGSLETWARYFENAKKIIGCDIDEKCKEINFENKVIELLIGDVNSQEVFDEIRKNMSYDIVIDDGSHLSEDIILSFLNYFPFVAPNGIYVIEDTHAVYRRSSTGIENKYNVFGFFKDLTDIINYQFWMGAKDIDQLLMPYLNIPIPEFIKVGWIESIEFRNSIITIKKSNVEGIFKLGKMVVSGSVAVVNDEPLNYKNLS